MVHRYFYCPYCNAGIDYKVGYGHSDVGSETAKCPSCGKEFLTGKSEWKDKSKWQKAKYFASSPLRLIGSLVEGAIIGAIVMFAISYSVFDGNLSGEIMSGGVAICAVISAYFWWRELKEDTSGKS